jgi:uroporphyrinogen decarboxylase
MPIVGDLIEIGVNVLNRSAKALDISLCKAYGDKISFFGGFCNQQILPYGSPEEIDENVREVTAILGAKGRYIIAPSNGMALDVPLENVEAFYKAASRYRYRS